MGNRAYHPCHGFTLVELSIVLVIIGLITGGILVGRDLIEAANVRAFIRDTDKFRTAAKTFQAKYGGIPGDLVSSEAVGFDFAARSGTNGRGDGDGLVETCGGPTTNAVLGCEQTLFWRDLSDAKLINYQFATATDALAANLTLPMIPQYFPPAGVGESGYTVAISNIDGAYQGGFSGVNSFVIAALLSTDVSGLATFDNVLTPQQAYTIDLKVDDGKPFAGNVKAHYHNGSGSFLFGAIGPNTCTSVAAQLVDMQYLLADADRNQKRCIMIIKF